MARNHPIVKTMQTRVLNAKKRCEPRAFLEKITEKKIRNDNHALKDMLGGRSPENSLLQSCETGT